MCTGFIWPFIGSCCEGIFFFLVMSYWEFTDQWSGPAPWCRLIPSVYTVGRGRVRGMAGLNIGPGACRLNLTDAFRVFSRFFHKIAIRTP